MNNNSLPANNRSILLERKGFYFMNQQNQGFEIKKNHVNQREDKTAVQSKNSDGDDSWVDDSEIVEELGLFDLV